MIILKIFSKLDDLLSDVRLKIVNKKMQIKENMMNCKKKCPETCKRVIALGKNESLELCNLKCELACSNNALTLLLK